MEEDKRPIYIWVVVLLANLSAIFFILPETGYSFSLVVSCSLLFSSVIPVLISKSSYRWKDRLGYGIPILLLLPLPYFVYDYFTCTGKFCALAPLFLGMVFVSSAIVFTLFYAMGIYFRRWDVKAVLSLISIEAALLAFSIAYFVLNF